MQIALTKSLIIKVLAAIAIFIFGCGFFIYYLTLNKVDQKYKEQQSKGGSIPISTADLKDDFISLQQEGADNPQTGGLNVSGTVQGSIFTSTVQDGSSPLNVDSQTLVKNLNTDMVDGKHADSFEPANSQGTDSQYLRGDKTWQTINKTTISLGNVENTALSTWSGSANITALGTVAQGIWNGTAIQDAYIATSANWNTAFNQTRQWDGGATGLNAATGKTSLGLNNVENTALSTWTGTANINTVGTITTGTWNAGAVTSSGALQGTSLSVGTGMVTSGAINATGALTVTGANATVNIAYGSEKITNGDFGSATGWTFVAPWTISGGKASRISGTYNSLEQTSAAMQTPLVVGEEYELTYTVSNFNPADDASVTPYIGGRELIRRYTAGTYTEKIRPLLNTNNLVFEPRTGTSAFDIDNVSLKKFTGGDLTVVSDATFDKVDLTSFSNVRLVFEGDSLTMANGNLEAKPDEVWTAKISSLNPYFGRATSYNYAVSGERASQMVGQYATEAHLHMPTKDIDDCIFFLWAGTNDINNADTAANIYNNLKTLWASARTDGYKVVAFTIEPSSYFDAGEEVVRQDLNNLIISDPSLYDYVIRLDLIFTDYTDTTYYLAGGGHFNATGNLLIAQNVDMVVGKNGMHSTGTNNLFIASPTGAAAGNLKLTVASAINNVAVGSGGLHVVTTANNNTAVGSSALYSLTTATSTTAVGSSAQYSNLTGSYSTAIGSQALYSNISGQHNSAMGRNALYSNQSGDRNISIGSNSLYNTNPTTGSITAFADYGGTVPGTVKATTSVAHGLGTNPGDTVAGIEILGTTNYNGVYTVTRIDATNFYFTKTWVTTETGKWSKDTEGRYNTAVGMVAGYANTTGSYNTFIGYAAGNISTATLQNATAIGYNAQVTADNSMVFGGTGVDAVKVGIGDTNPDTTLKVVGSICAKSDGNDCAGSTAGTVYASAFVDDGVQLTVPDYVFEEGYNLMPIGDLKNYVQTNKHLPNIQGMADIKEHGLNYGQMIMGLLEKTEENTLYIIDNSGKTDTNTQSVANIQLQTQKNTEAITQLQNTLNSLLNDKVVIPENLKVKTAEVNTLIVTGNATFKGTLTLENGVKIDTKGPKPVCDEIRRGTIWISQNEGADVKDVVEVCIKDKSVYIWQALNP